MKFLKRKILEYETLREEIRALAKDAESDPGIAKEEWRTLPLPD
jgi:hypothetical protein